MNIEISELFITEQLIINKLSSYNLLHTTEKYGFILGSQRAISVDNNAFSVCGNNLSAIALNRSNIVYVGNYAFKDCTNLSSMCTSSRYYGVGAFMGCSNLTQMKFNDNFKNIVIDSYCFKDCTALNTIENLSYVSNWNTGSFENCQSLTSLNIPNNISGIPQYSFRNCFKLSKINNMQNIESIGNYAFDGCESFPSKITLNNCESIGRYAFRGCKNLETLIAPKCTFVDYNAFYDTKLWNVEPS